MKRKINLIKQAKSLELTAVYELVQYYVSVYNNGQFSAIERLINELTMDAKLELILRLKNQDFEVFMYFYNLINK